ncbi:cupin domain-containing protein [Gryllotalpicola protaetiae]|nr:cupin domain-containing protein [Gryllotalpicola protaetiae]
MSDHRGALPSVSSKELGSRIRSLRRFSGLSTRQLAEAIAVTPNAITQIERGAMRPSVNRLIEIVSVLDVPLSAIFDERPASTASEFVASANPIAADPEEARVSRAAQVPPVGLGSRVTYRRLTPHAVRRFEMFETSYPPHTSSGAPGKYLVHRGQEIGSIISGALTIEFPGTEIVLGPRDSITFSAGRPHRVRNDGNEYAIALWVTFRGDA